MGKRPAKSIQPPNPVADKAIKGGPNAVSVDMLERAEQVMADAAGDYLGWVQGDLRKLRAALDSLVESDDGHAEALGHLFEISHEMKGQGGAFGYDLMTVIADHMCQLIERLDGKAGPAEIEVLQLYVDALHVVIAKELTADGGPEGKRLLDGLAKVSARLS